MFPLLCVLVDTVFFFAVDKCSFCDCGCGCHFFIQFVCLHVFLLVASLQCFLKKTYCRCSSLVCLFGIYFASLVCCLCLFAFRFFTASLFASSKAFGTSASLAIRFGRFPWAKTSGTPRLWIHLGALLHVADDLALLWIFLDIREAPKCSWLLQSGRELVFFFFLIKVFAHTERSDSRKNSVHPCQTGCFGFSSLCRLIAWYIKCSTIPKAIQSRYADLCESHTQRINATRS